jgi:hypothetical protein
LLHLNLEETSSCYVSIAEEISDNNVWKNDNQGKLLLPCLQEFLSVDLQLGKPFSSLEQRIRILDPAQETAFHNSLPER